ncbi:alpha-galactosidase [Ruania sp. N2-46]|uniref:Alpha-galactosidase n=2 Tax=Occultella gossypii TaxID=2800820 RepID=A0ABS7S9T9_9MICO|nr:alpha-galactosidase [Occultella gossypii]
MRTIVWFEPERVRAGTWLHVNHPEWLLATPGGTDNFLLDFGNADALAWASTTMGDMIVNDGIDVYREDFNIGPLPLWRANDVHGRRGMKQIRYVEGHLAYWKALQTRRPGLVIDTCASGGRRMDVETLGVSVNFLRSDRVLNATANQTHQHGVSSWVGLHGGVARVTGGPTDVYDSRSAYAPSMHHALDVRQADAPWETLKELAAEWHGLSGHLYGDYYPLTAGGAAPDIWIAWQFGQPDGSAGYVQVFRRPDAAETASTIRLRGLTPDASYTLTDRDSGTTQELLGQALIDGIEVSIDSAPSSRVLEYQKV